ncbi:pyridoxal phosphate-dependent aminotransferase [Pseudonocardia endophytica]|uniref:Aspartate/methionine/tyrosine aminotransferase n=1 Tax=Pseudonocardia endophytica TaxID=401976 RepID=A0A4R1HUG0_PSEEN|nr:pyridoxal phosphate-dependent aminotransferase [Pseudonocardia endophytica]TCK24585.1 aspartate/methionine/tyrosine aminotransferase [Pseudonocardia endophytica]
MTAATTAPGRAELLDRADRSGWAPIDLSLGNAGDRAPVEGSADLGGYPLCRGSEELRHAVAAMFRRDLDLLVDAGDVAACAGVKEFIATTPLLLRGREPRDTVLVPQLAYPPYRHGVRLAGLVEHAVPTGPDGRMDLAAVPEEVAARALMLWVTSPGNPTGVVEDLRAVVAWGRARGVPVFVDEAYVDLVWSGEPGSVLRYGPDGVVAVQSLSKSFGHPGARLGWFAGDPGIVAQLVAARRETGLIASAPSQAHAVAVLTAGAAARAQRRELVGARLGDLVSALRDNGIGCPDPPGGMFAWVAAPDGDGDAFARRLATGAGIVAAPGSGFGDAGRGHVRLAAVAAPGRVAARMARCQSLSDSVEVLR